MSSSRLLTLSSLLLVLLLGVVSVAAASLPLPTAPTRSMADYVETRRVLINTTLDAFSIGNYACNGSHLYTASATSGPASVIDLTSTPPTVHNASIDWEAAVRKFCPTVSINATLSLDGITADWEGGAVFAAVSMQAGVTGQAVSFLRRTVHGRWSPCYTQHWRAPGYYTASRNSALYIGVDQASVAYSFDLRTMTAQHDRFLVFAESGLYPGWDGRLYTSMAKFDGSGGLMTSYKTDLNYTDPLSFWDGDVFFPDMVATAANDLILQTATKDVLSSYHLCIMPGGTNVSQCEQALSGGWLLTDHPHAFSLFRWNTSLTAGELITRTLKHSAQLLLHAQPSTPSDVGEGTNVTAILQPLLGAVCGVLLLAVMLAALYMRCKTSTASAATSGGHELLLQ